MIIRNITISLFKPTPGERPTSLWPHAASTALSLFADSWSQPAAAADNHRMLSGDWLRPQRPALSYLRQWFTKRWLRAETFEADISDFGLSRPVDSAYCTVSPFRYLLPEQSARSHLRCIAGLRPCGIYVLGFRLLSLDLAKERDRRWTGRRCETKLTVTFRVLRIDRTSRIVNLMVCLLVRCKSNQIRLRHEFQLRTYTAKQFKLLLDSVPLLELCDVYDLRYDVEHPLLLNDKVGYTLFVLRRRLLS
jgi:hypothetical protein